MFYILEEKVFFFYYILNARIEREKYIIYLKLHNALKELLSYIPFSNGLIDRM